MKKFNFVVCGGTFDHFHKGHREFLRFAISKGEKVVLGLTDDEYVKNKFKNDFFESYKIRLENVKSFLKKEKKSGKVKITAINNIFGPTLSKKINFNAIIVSENSLKGAEIINKKRKEKGLQKLKIFVKKMVKAKDGEIISSSRIRKGIINREGKLYIKPSWFFSNIKVSDKVRKVLKRPLGRLIERNIKENVKVNSDKIITVGDVVTKFFNDNSLCQKISVIDFHGNRKKIFSNLKQLGFNNKELIVKINNPPGFITPEIFKISEKIFSDLVKERIVIEITGEEDLMVLPLLLSAPLGFSIYYGQPEEGVVEVLATEESKENIFNLLNSL